MTFDIDDEIFWYCKEMGTIEVDINKLKDYLIDDFSEEEIDDAIENQLELGMIQIRC